MTSIELIFSKHLIVSQYPQKLILLKTKCDVFLSIPNDLPTVKQCGSQR